MSYLLSDNLPLRMEQLHLSLLSGYYGEGLNAIIVFAACYLPDSSCDDYTYIMENLFL